MTIKSVSVLGSDGAGKKTLIGSLIYKCGLELLQLQELERKGIRRFEEIAPFFEERGRVQSFYGPSSQFIIGKSMTPDVVFWVVDATDSTNWSLSVQKLAKLLSHRTLQPREKLVILVNKMDMVKWSEQTFREAVCVFNAAELNHRAYIIPISSLRGENMLSTPQEFSWVKDMSTNQLGGSRLVSGQPLMGLLE